MTLKAFLAGIALTVAAMPASAQLDSIEVIGQSAPAITAAPSSTSTVLSSQDLSALPYDRLDDALSAKTGFSLFRRQPSLSANPTIQGASLRGIGPNGAGRAAVLLDGAPLNDPFGNWVNWASILPGTISSASVLPGSRPLSAGPGALSGLIAIETSQSRAGLSMRFDANSLEGGDASIVYAASLGDIDMITFAGGGLREGFIPIAQSQRGPADVSAASHNVAGGIKLGRDFGNAWRGALLLRGFSEARDNGLEGAQNDTQGFDGSVRVRTTGASAVKADIDVYGQVRRFASLFTATDAARAVTRPVLDQFSVPSYAFGGRAHLSRDWSDAQKTSLYAQADWRSGETNERFRNLGNGFTRQRAAGGRQSTLGAGLEHRARVTPQLTLDGGVRVDVLQLSRGMRVETNLDTGDLVRNDQFDERTDTVISGAAGVRYQPVAAWTLKARGYTGSRQPSLNEYFRPFRVGNDITEANPLLDIETLRGLDVSARFEPLNGHFAQVTLFRNWLRDAVGNLSVAGQAGGFIAPCGFVPTGGSCRQRGNIERSRATGVEVAAGTELHDQFSASLFYGYTRAKITRSAVNPALEGKRFAQVPTHQGSIDLRWTAPSSDINGSLIVRAQSKQFDDDLNTRALSAFAAVDLAVRWQIDETVTVRLEGINLTDTQIEAGQSSDGLITRGQPLTVRFGLSAQF
ncbi:MAG: TonB-dependent receptor [Pseudomonadota bacterium]